MMVCVGVGACVGVGVWVWVGACVGVWVSILIELGESVVRS